MKSTKMPFALYVLGIIVAISGATKLPAPEATWSDTVPFFIVGVVICLTGLIWWRKAIKPAVSGDRTSAKESLAAIMAHLTSAQEMMKTISSQFDALDTDSLRDKVDEVLIGHLTPFSDNRGNIIDQLGMKDGAQLILQAATVERNLNRVWSAAADECMPEAKVSLSTALHAMDDAVALANA